MSAKETAKVKIIVPEGCRRTALSIDALDSRTVELAFATNIEVDGKTLFCRSFKVKELADGSKVCLLEVQEPSFEIVEAGKEV